MRGMAGIIASIVLMIPVIVGCEDDSVRPPGEEYSDSETHDYVVGDSVSIVASTFVGAITFTEGVAGAVQITVTKHAAVEEDLELVEVELTQTDSEIVIRASNPQDRQHVDADIAISAPPGACLNLAAGVGSVDCTGRPGDLWTAGVGVGAAEFSIPSDASVSLELLTGVGTVDVGFAVVGEVTSQRVIFPLRVEKDKEAVLTYTVRYTW